MNKENFKVIGKGDNFVIFEINKFSTIEPIYFASDGVDIGVEDKGHSNPVICHIPVDKSKSKVRIKIEVICD